MKKYALDLIKSTSFFSTCRYEDLLEIASNSTFSSFKEGNTIFSPGTESRSLYIVDSGKVVLSRTDDAGKEIDIASYLRGHYFGELDMFTGSKRNVTARAVDGPASLLIFPSGEKGVRTLDDLGSRTYSRLMYSILIQVSSRNRDVINLVRENTHVVQELRKQVYSDKLTGLFNKTYFEESLAKELSGKHKSVGVLFAKPDNFKEINDTFGHESGDKVLRYIADQLKAFVPEDTMVFRFMGNENSIILPGAGRNMLRGFAEDIKSFLSSIDLTIILGGNSVNLTFSFGLAISPQHGKSVEELCNSAHPLTLEGRSRGGNMILFPENSQKGQTE